MFTSPPEQRMNVTGKELYGQYSARHDKPAPMTQPFNPEESRYQAFLKPELNF
jgi:hypothetical protein